ncbi:MAG TPA: hypothetical protein VLT17_06135 [Gemmatimonadales bacterium]|nr:hypothetical protein [Gemmatimonadales bacterium]
MPSADCRLEPLRTQDTGVSPSLSPQSSVLSPQFLPRAWRVVLATALAIHLQALPAAAQVPGANDPGACTLIAPGEAEAALGSKVVDVQHSDVLYTKGSANDHDGTLHLCVYTVGTASFRLAYSTSPVTPAGKQANNASNASTQQRMRDQGWKLSAQQIGEIKCWTAVAPKELITKNAGRTQCDGEKGAYFVTLVITVPDPKALVSMETTSKLVQLAVPRLPNSN